MEMPGFTSPLVGICRSIVASTFEGMTEDDTGGLTVEGISQVELNKFGSASKQIFELGRHA
jgi:hypothetical protein